MWDTIHYDWFEAMSKLGNRKLKELYFQNIKMIEVMNVRGKTIR